MDDFQQLEQCNRKLEREIAARKQKEEALQQALDELEQQVERTAELRTANEELRREIARAEQNLQALQESEERFRGLVEELPVGIGYTSPEGDVFYHNPHARRMIGYSEQDLTSLRT